MCTVLLSRNSVKFSANKRPAEVIKKGRLDDCISEAFILVLLESGTKNPGKNLISWKILIRSIIAQIVMMSVSINMMLNAEHR